MTEITITYHNASGKRNQMMIDMDVFFPCAKSWLAKLQKTVISRSDDPERYTDMIRSYLLLRLELTQNWIREYSIADLPVDDVSIADFNKMKRNENKIRACLDLIGGTDEQHGDSNAGQEPARDQKQSTCVDLSRIQPL